MSRCIRKVCVVVIVRIKPSVNHKHRRQIQRRCFALIEHRKICRSIESAHILCKLNQISLCHAIGVRRKVRCGIPCTVRKRCIYASAQVYLAWRCGCGHTQNFSCARRKLFGNDGRRYDFRHAARCADCRRLQVIRRRIFRVLCGRIFRVFDSRRRVSRCLLVREQRRSCFNLHPTNVIVINFRPRVGKFVVNRGGVCTIAV